MAADDHENDNDLLRGMLAGDEESFAALYVRRQGAVYRFALHMTGSAPFAEDVAQETFLALLNSGRRFDPSRGSLVSFLYGIARNLVLRRLGKDRGEPTALADEPACDEDLLDDLTRRETIGQVRRAVISLPHSYREVVVLCDLENATYEEAAAALDCPVGTVRSRLSRGRAMLAQKLEKVGMARSISCAAKSVL
ncbi:MAG TPA: sigma-70 family RNA polymerase sigma factor [Bryobacteraceae bacterium]|nr:sigma-70 family RNA polymerase sigma factor [Bryobacteraceae bacterium]